jgi:hypothetical protein
MTVNFTNILRAAFHTKVLFTAFMCLQFGFVICWWKDFGAKAAHKMLVKLSPGGKNTLASSKDFSDYIRDVKHSSLFTHKEQFRTQKVL